MKHRCPTLAARAPRKFDGTFAERVPGVAGLARLFERIASARLGRVPIGLVALLPIALFIDFLDIPDELLGGPIGMGLSFILEAAFLLGLTGRASYAFAFAGLDLIPFVDTMPWATITLVRTILGAWSQEGPQREPPPQGPIIDV